MDSYLSVYKRNERLYIVPSFISRDGRRLGGDFVLMATCDEGSSSLADALREALEISLHAPSKEPDRQEARAALHKAANSRSEREFVRGTRICGLHRIDDSFVVLPMRPGKGLNFQFEPTRTERLPATADLATVAQRILEVLAESEEH